MSSCFQKKNTLWQVVSRSIVFILNSSCCFLTQDVWHFLSYFRLFLKNFETVNAINSVTKLYELIISDFKNIYRWKWHSSFLVWSHLHLTPSKTPCISDEALGSYGDLERVMCLSELGSCTLSLVVLDCFSCSALVHEFNAVKCLFHLKNCLFFEEWTGFFFQMSLGFHVFS